MREDGFYWVRLPINGNVEVCRWSDDVWYCAGWDLWYDDAEVTVLSPRLEPPKEEEKKS